MAPTPPMGWSNWNYFGKEAINEKMIKECIDSIVSSGLKDAGYGFVILDGGWRDTKLGPNGELLAHPVRFPGGIKAMADYAHSKGLKFGLHTVPGTHDCGGDPVGGWGHEEVQFQQFVDWGVDIIKLDKCRFSFDKNPSYSRNDPRWRAGWDPKLNNLEKAFTKWNSLINNSGKKILFMAYAYQFVDWYPRLANTGRTTGDIKSKQSGGAIFDTPSVRSIMSIATKNNKSSKFAHPGYWNDADMLVTGNQGLTNEEQKAHFALWCIMSSQLTLGNDPRIMTDEEKKIILNKQAIAINQDPTEQGKRIKVDGKGEVWAKKLKNGNYAVLLLNRDSAAVKEVKLNWTDLGLSGKQSITDIYARQKLGKFDNSFSKSLQPHSSIFLEVSK